MKKIILSILSICYFSASFSQLISKKESASIDQILADLSNTHKPKTYIVRNVNILTMKDHVPLAQQSVLIENGIIQQIGPNLQHPDATIIDGSDKFIMPGLTDMHVHLFDKHPMKNTWMLLLLTNGVTSVRDMCGEAEKIKLREKIKNGEILGPNLYQAGPIINGIKDNMGLFAFASTPAQGREIVINQKNAGYDFIKVYDDLTKEVYEAIVDEAHKQGMMVDGHLPNAVSIDDAITLQHNSIEHLTGYFEWDRSQVEINGDVNYAQTANSTLWNCPTIYNHFLNGSRQGANEMFAYAETSGMIPTGLQNTWKKMINSNAKAIAEVVDKYGASNFDAIKKIVTDLHKAGAKLVAGTDAGNLPLMIPGYSLHQELKLMTDLGISPYDVLKMSTINAAQAMRKDMEIGTVEVGNRADLLLLNANPLDDVANLQNVSGVMVRGIWLSTGDLAKIKGDMRSTFRK
jgi:imidazolonepropionase-like amidohydrolase